MLHNVVVLYQRTIVLHIQLYSVDQSECRFWSPNKRLQNELFGKCPGLECAGVLYNAARRCRLTVFV